jgi:hypothetical protein
MDNDRCENCRHWLNAGPHEKVCRRFPPNAKLIPGQGMQGPQTVSFFPPMAADGYCGEHRPLKSEVVAFEPRPFQPEPGDGTGRL